MPLVSPSTDFDFCSIILPTSMDTSLLVVWVGVQVWGWSAVGDVGGISIQIFANVWKVRAQIGACGSRVPYGERRLVSDAGGTYPTEMPCLAMVWFASWNRCDAWRSALDGMHPTLRQVPPRVPRPSTQVTLRPSWAPLMAAT